MGDNTRLTVAPRDKRATKKKTGTLLSIIVVDFIRDMVTIPVSVAYSPCKTKLYAWYTFGFRLIKSSNAANRTKKTARSSVTTLDIGNVSCGIRHLGNARDCFGWKPAATGTPPAGTSHDGNVRHLLGGNRLPQETSHGNRLPRDFFQRELSHHGHS